MWKDRHVLVTGGSGLIGRPLIARLQDEGAVVWNYDLTEGCSILNRDSLNSAMNWKDVVFHLAAVSGVEESRRMGCRALETNIVGTMNVLEAARLAPSIKAVVVASSNHVYGDHHGELTAEWAPLQQLDTYSVSKICADYLARAYAHNYSLPTVVIRNTNCFGPGNDHPEHLIEGTILSVLRGERPVIRGTGKTMKSFLYVDDVVDAFLKAGEWNRGAPPMPWGNAFNISGTRYRVRDIVTLVCTLLKRLDLEPIIEGNDRDQADENLDTGRAMAWLRWEPQVSLETGILRTAEWYSRHPELLGLKVV